jgi:preprotein translocase subunit SecE
MAEKATKGSKWTPRAIFERIRKFFRDQKSEVKKIVWPTRKQVLNNTGAVLVAVIIVAVTMGAFDGILTAVVKALLGS